MLQIQRSFLQSALRRLTQAVGDQNLGQDEVLSPIIRVGDASVAPFRDEPLAFGFTLEADGAAGANFNFIAFGLGDLPGERGAAVITRVTISSQEVLAAGAHAAVLFWHTGSTNGTPLGLGLEPSFVAASLPARYGPTASALADASPAVNLRIREHRLAGGAGAILTADMPLDPPILLVPPRLLGGWLGAMLVGTDAGAAAAAMTASVYGFYYQTYPTR